MLNQLDIEKRLPPVKYFVDSPLSIKITETVKKYPDHYNSVAKALLDKDTDIFSFNGLTFVETKEESMALNEMKEPIVIISSSGMAEAGRVKHHIAHNVEDARNTIMLTGYCEPRSLGGRLKTKPDEVSIFGKHYQVRADVEQINSLSAHADYDDLCQWLACQDKTAIKKIFLVHGEYDVQMIFQDKLIRKGYTDVEIPEQHQVIGLG
jgi:metallo-beta-lactamase family protein